MQYNGKPVDIHFARTEQSPDKVWIENIVYSDAKLNSFGIYDRITLEETKRARLKEDIIKILSEAKKFGVYNADHISEEATIKNNKQVEAGF